MEKSFAPTLRVEVITWGAVTRLASRLAGTIRAAAYHPDLVVAIARGGYIPARLLCDHLSLYNLTSLRIAHYTGAEINGQARIVSPLATDIKDKRILLVDDVSDSGDTLALALEHLKALAPQELRLAVLQHKVNASIVPDFYAQKIIHWRWITYPWALVEDLGGFLRAMQPVPATPEQAAACLAQQYGISVPRKVLEDVLAGLAAS
jgi:hypoxanthine phosphoribosyltransferase